MKVLGVEDSRTQAVALRRILEKHGFETSMAHDSAEALAHLESHRPDLIITDIMMPGRDGFQLCEIIKNDQRYSSIPVILLTSLSDPEDVLKALRCGADSFITKPCTEKFLIEQMHKVLRGAEYINQAENADETEVFYGDKTHSIRSPRVQMLNLLFSTYENAVQKNAELRRANDELTRTKKQLEDKNSELAALNESKNQFLGMAAHDLRNPLGIIEGYSGILVEEAATLPVEQRRNFLERIQHSSRFMLQLVNDLLDISSIEAGKLELRKRDCSIADLIHGSVELQRISADKKQIQLTEDVQVGMPDIRADVDKLEQVLNNLLSNAVKYSHPGSRVEVSAQQMNGSVVVAVRDEGQGIPADELDNLFKPFAKTSVRGTAGEKSTGLGLVIVRKIVEGHQGEISVESRVNQGSTFRFKLPVNVSASG